MTISNEARSAACEAFDQVYFHDAKDSDERLYLSLMAGIAATLSAAPAAEPDGTRVKQLEWERPNCGPDEYRHIGKAESLGFRYEVKNSGSTTKPWTATRSTDIQPFGWSDSLAGAIALAQADFEARILSALQPSAVVPVAWQRWSDTFGWVELKPDEDRSLYRVRPLFAAPPLPKEYGLREVSPDDLRNLGWTVAVHNDYRLNGEQFTFWLFTKAGRAIKGEGRTDAEALNAVRAALHSEGGK